MKQHEEKKTAIFCATCQKPSGYFVEDFIDKLVKETQYCKNCNAPILDKPDFPEPIYN